MVAKKNVAKERRTSERQPIKADLEFILYLDAFKAKTLDVSKKGIRFETDTPIIIRLQYKKGGKSVVRDAELVWAARQDSGKMGYGFEFIPSLD